MPFRSKAQARWMFANHPKMAKRWAKHTKSIKNLPDKVSKKKSKGRKRKRDSRKRDSRGRFA